MCLTIPHELVGVGRWYRDFTPVSDAEVLALLGRRPRQRGRPRRLAAAASDRRRRRARGRPHASGRPERAGDLRARQRLEPAQPAQPRRRRGAQRCRLRDAAVRPADGGRSASGASWCSTSRSWRAGSSSSRAGRSRTAADATAADRLLRRLDGRRGGAAGSGRGRATWSARSSRAAGGRTWPPIAGARCARRRCCSSAAATGRCSSSTATRPRCCGCPHQLMIVQGAGHLFEEPGALDAVARAAAALVRRPPAHRDAAPGGRRELTVAARRPCRWASARSSTRSGARRTRSRATSRDYDALLARIGDARFVLLGEATHGTHEFYRERARITKRLIRERGFTAVAVEADWPDAYRVNRYVRGARDRPRRRGGAARLRALPGLDVAQRRRARLRRLAARRTTRDCTAAPARPASTGSTSTASPPRSRPSSPTSRRAIRTRPRGRAPATSACSPSRPTAPGTAERSCSASRSRVAARVVEQLRRAAPQRRRLPAPRRACSPRTSSSSPSRTPPWSPTPRSTTARCSATVPAAGTCATATWPTRSTSCSRTSTATAAPPASSCGRTTRTSATPGRPRWARRGELNLGQLVRERHGDDVVIVGFTTYAGTVTAASDWGAPAERKRVRRALAGSYEALFHATGLPAFLLLPAAGGRQRRTRCASRGSSGRSA